MAEGQQWQGKTRGGKFGQQFLFFILRYIKVTTLYPVLYVIIPFCLLFARKPNDALYHYFRRIRGYGRWQAFWAMACDAHNFGKVVIDKFALLAGRSDQFNIHVHHPEIFDNLLAQDGGFMLAGSHMGNFELLGQCLKQDKKAINGLVYGGESAQLQQRRVNQFQQNHVKLISVSPDMSHLFAIKDALDQGEIITILCDRVFGAEKSKPMSFLGHDAAFPLGPFRLAAQMEVPVVSVFMMKEKKRDYSCYLVPLQVDNETMSKTQRVESLMHQYVQSLENILQQYPEQWFNLYEFWPTK